ncbi:phage transposase domain protein [Shigella dysenteriae 1617]|nr:phage transposase domain protein [Shigella dysenteriae 1617]
MAQLMATDPQEITTQPPVKRERKQNVVQPVEAYRGSPQLVEERLNALTENQRKVAEALRCTGNSGHYHLFFF